MDGVRQEGRSSRSVNDPEREPADASSGINPKQIVAASLKRERTRAGLSIGELARRAGIGKSTLSQLESGDGNPSVETLWALSTALGLQFSALLDAPVHPVEVIRFGDGPVIPAAAADYSATLLSTARPGTRRDMYLIRAEPGEPRVSAPHSRGVVEHVVISAGRARVGPTDAAVELGAGDYVSYAGDIEHVFAALVPGTVAVMISEST
ncbi:helix-turn-helix domain-containing protein [Gordonia hankookensis]|uniref:Helix-turn-helix transcriptional regulator n=1 Tax=Gordonia hankookensis TaxID=589403 RepID=A0ABR7WEP2_9ACTN|nr:XRE family transcriptional regulator [Gordonia hankookensis]MBD1321250.1 helix-turn-helix transcriptional regulator [Gordonia hankookensis]